MPNEESQIKRKFPSLVVNTEDKSGYLSVSIEVVGKFDDGESILNTLILAMVNTLHGSSLGKGEFMKIVERKANTILHGIEAMPFSGIENGDKN